MAGASPKTAGPAPAPCCRQLRCKSLYYRADERPGLLHPSGVMDYWCGLTNVDLGPDGHAAGHSRCQPGRSCFQGEPVA